MVAKRKDNKGRVLKEGESQRANGTYEYKYRDIFNNRRSIYAKTLEELREKENDILRNKLNGMAQCKTTMTVNDLYYGWLNIKEGLKDNTLQNYKYLYNQFVKDSLGKRKVLDLKSPDIREFYKYLHDTKGIKISTIDNIHTILHQVIDYAVEKEYLYRNIADSALKDIKRIYNYEIKKKKALRAKEQLLLEEFLADSKQYNRWYPIFIVMLWTGMRVGEVTGLRWCDVDFEKNIINVNHTLIYYSKGKDVGGNIFAVHPPKSEAGIRNIPMLPIVREALLLEKQYQEETGIKCKFVLDEYSDFIFVNRFGEVQHQGTLNKALRRIIRDCNSEVINKAKSADKETITLPDMSCHILRHTFGTRLNEQKVNPKVMQTILGHADIRTTFNLYVTATDEFVEEQVEEFRQNVRQLTTDLRQLPGNL